MNQTNQMNQPEEQLRRQPEEQQEEQPIMSVRDRWFSRAQDIISRMNRAKQKIERGEFLNDFSPNYSKKIRLIMSERNTQENQIFISFFDEIIKTELLNYGSAHSINYDFEKFKNGYIYFNKNSNEYMYSKTHYKIIEMIFYDRRLTQKYNLGRDINEIDLLHKYYELYNYPWWFLYKVGGMENPYLYYETLY